MKDNFNKDNYWLNNYENPKYYNWSGYSFEILCLNHLPNILNALGISGIQTNCSTWSNENAQIDLIIERSDNINNLFEIKYSKGSYIITKKYDVELRNKVQEFIQNSKERKAVWPIFLAPYGLGKSPYNHFFVKAFDMKILFDKT